MSANTQIRCDTSCGSNIIKSVLVLLTFIFSLHSIFVDVLRMLYLGSTGLLAEFSEILQTCLRQASCKVCSLLHRSHHGPYYIAHCKIHSVGNLRWTFLTGTAKPNEWRHKSNGYVLYYLGWWWPKTIAKGRSWFRAMISVTINTSFSIFSKLDVAIKS